MSQVAWPLRFAGLDSGPVRESLAGLFAAVKQTSIFDEAQDAAARLGKRSHLGLELSKTRTNLAREIREVRQGEIGEDAFRRQRLTVSQAYSAHPELDMIVASLRSLNRLVTHVIWTLLGLAEQVAPIRITEVRG